MTDPNPIFVVDLEPDEGLNLRAQPSTAAAALTALLPGQLVARLDEDDRDGWLFVFADTPGEGAYTGYVLATKLAPWSGYASPSTGGGAAPGAVTPPPPAAPPPSAPTPTPAPVGEPNAWPVPAGKPAALDWNPKVLAERRYNSECRTESQNRVVNRVVIHITGNADFAACHDTYMNHVAPHYVVDTDGGVHQYVQEKDRAWHAGIKGFERRIYDRGDGSWRRFQRYHSWRDYDAGTIFLADDAQTEVAREHAVLVARADGSEWSDFHFFDERWGREQKLPIGYADTKDGNGKSIGIEILGTGSREPSSAHYTEAMYAALAELVTDICERYELPRIKGVVCGHEDVNPIARGMWDPNQGFDWTRVWAPDDV